jgi:hypothetical protein
MVCSGHPLDGSTGHQPTGANVIKHVFYITDEGGNKLERFSPSSLFSLV